MASSHLIFDLGASSGRAMIGRLEAGKLTLREAHRFKNYPVERGGSWFWEFDHLVAELKEGFRKAFALDPEITTFSIDTWGVDYVFFRGGKPVRDPFNYRDERTYAAMEALHRKVSREDLFAATGIQLMNINTVYQLWAHREAFPGDFEDGSMLLFMPDALHFVLTGDTRTEYTIASTGALLDPRTREWNRGLLAELGLPASVFTPIVPPSTAGMPLRAEIAAELGIPRIAGIKCGSHDTASAVAALPLRDGGAAAYVSLGTWALLGAELAAPMLSAEAGRAHYTNEGGLEKISGSNYAQSEASGEPTSWTALSLGSKIKSGYLEMSNVNAADEMVNMIITQRAYEMNAKAITASDEMLQQANNLRS